MNIDVFTLCDAATNTNGKLNIFGVFNTISATKTPAIHAQCAVALRTRFSRLEQGKHQIQLRFVDADGKSIMPDLDGELNVKFDNGSMYAVSELVLQIQRLVFPKFGDYAVDLMIDGRHEKSLPLQVVQLPSLN